MNLGISLDNGHFDDIIYALDRSSVVAITDGRGIITHVNDRFCELSQYSREELIGKTHRVINSGYHTPEYFEEMWKTISSGQIWRGEMRNRAKDGSHYWVDNTIVPFLDTHGRPRKYVSIRTVITDRKRMEEERAELTRKTEGAIRQREEMLAIVSHDLKNPLTTILMNSTLIARTIEQQRSSNPTSSELIKNQAEMIHRSVVTMNKLIHDLLDQAKTDAGHMPLAKEKQHIPSLVRDTMTLLEPLAKAKSLKLVENCDGENDHLHALCDKNRMQQVLSNLIGNAIKYTNSGSITIATRSIPKGVHVSVTDTGPGIPKDQLNRVFDRYWQANPSNEGSGLGLSIARSIIEAHGGGIGVESIVGKGTTFWFTISAAATTTLDKAANN